MVLLNLLDKKKKLKKIKIKVSRQRDLEERYNKLFI